MISEFHLLCDNASHGAGDPLCIRVSFQEKRIAVTSLSSSLLVVLPVKACSCQSDRKLAGDAAIGMEEES